MLDKWLDSRTWRNWWKPPSFSWWWKPSGSPPVNPPWYYYLKSPLVAHTIGVMIPFGIASIWCSFWGAWAIGVAVVFKGQLQKADALLPSGYNMQNVFYRTLIAVVVPFVVMTI